MSAIQYAEPLSAPSVPSPARDVLDLVRSLGRAEWGPLAGTEWRGPRAILGALADLMHDARTGRSATLTITATQVAARAGYGVRWTRVCLQVLEDVGVIEWHRGGVIDGKPRPGIIRVIKTRLCEWITLARARHDERERRRRDETARRLRRLRSLRLAPRLPRSVHAAVSADLPPYGGGRRAASAPPSTPPPITDKENTTMATTKRDLPESVRLTRLRDQYMRNQGITSAEDVAYAHRHMATVKEWDRKIAAARKTERPHTPALIGEEPLW